MATSGDNGAFSARSGNDASASMLVTRVNLGEARLNGAALAACCGPSRSPCMSCLSASHGITGKSTV